MCEIEWMIDGVLCSGYIVPDVNIHYSCTSFFEVLKVRTKLQVKTRLTVCSEFEYSYKPK